MSEGLVEATKSYVRLGNKANIAEIASYSTYYINGNIGDSNFITPLYLRKSQAERALEGEK